MPITFQKGLLACFIVSLTACGGGGGGSDKPASSSSVSSQASSVVSSVSSQASSTSSVTSSIASSVQSSVSSNNSSLSSSLASSSQSSSSSSSTGVEMTSYRVNVNLPQLGNNLAIRSPSFSELFIAKAMADTELSAENFAVVIVDLSGNVLERITLTDNNIYPNSDGSWSIRVPGNPRLDCLIVVDPTKPIVLPVASNINAADLLFTPTTQTNLQVDLGSTSAFKELIDDLGGEGTFESAGLDIDSPEDLTAVQSLIANIQAAIEDLVFTEFSSIEDALVSIRATSQQVVAQEILNLNNPAEGTLGQSLTQGGLHWFESDGESGSIATGGETLYFYQDGELVPTVDDHQAIAWTDSGWQIFYDKNISASENQDGSVTLEYENGSQGKLTAIQSFSLNDRKVAEFALSNNWPMTLNPDTRFGATAKAFRANLEQTNETAELWYEPGNNAGECPWNTSLNSEDFGGNCEVAGGWTTIAGETLYKSPYDSLDNILSANVEPNTNGFVSIGINWVGNQQIMVQFVNDQAKTARFYFVVWQQGSRTFDLIGTGNWEYKTLTGTTETNVVYVDVPEAVRDFGQFEEGRTNFIFGVHAGLVRPGNLYTPRLVETNILLINGVAHDAVESALNYTSPLIGSWQTGDDIITFSKGSYVHTKTATDDIECSVGGSSGSYLWNSITGAFRINTNFDSTGNCTIDSVYKIIPAWDLTSSLTLMNNDEIEENQAIEVTRMQANALSGTWKFDDNNLFVFTNNSIKHTKTNNDDPNCSNGIARAFYIWDQEAGSIVIETTDDGTNNCSIEGEFELSIEGNTMSFASEEDSFSLTKVVN